MANKLSVADAFGQALRYVQEATSAVESIRTNLANNWLDHIGFIPMTQGTDYSLQSDASAPMGAIGPITTDMSTMGYEQVTLGAAKSISLAPLYVVTLRDTNYVDRLEDKPGQYIWYVGENISLPHDYASNRSALFFIPKGAKVQFVARGTYSMYLHVDAKDAPVVLARVFDNQAPNMCRWYMIDVTSIAKYLTSLGSTHDYELQGQEVTIV